MVEEEGMQGIVWRDMNLIRRVEVERREKTLMCKRTEERGRGMAVVERVITLGAAVTETTEDTPRLQALTVKYPVPGTVDHSPGTQDILTISGTKMGFQALGQRVGVGMEGGTSIDVDLQLLLIKQEVQKWASVAPTQSLKL